MLYNNSSGSWKRNYPQCLMTPIFCRRSLHRDYLPTARGRKTLLKEIDGVPTDVRTASYEPQV